LTLFCRKTEEV